MLNIFRLHNKLFGVSFLTIFSTYGFDKIHNYSELIFQTIFSFICIYEMNRHYSKIIDVGVK